MMVFSEELVEAGSKSMIELIDAQWDQARQYDPAWEHVLNQVEPEEVMENVYEFEKLVLKKVIEKLQQDLEDMRVNDLGLQG